MNIKNILSKTEHEIDQHLTLWPYSYDRGRVATVLNVIRAYRILLDIPPGNPRRDVVAMDLAKAYDALDLTSLKGALETIEREDISFERPPV